MATPETNVSIGVKINGKDVRLPAQLTVSNYLASRELKEQLVVVELNGTILNRSEFSSTYISAGDQIEIVHFVGGG